MSSAAGGTMTLMAGIDPYTPLSLGWAGHETSTPCSFCDDGTTPTQNVVRISDKMNRDVCPTCASSADPPMAKVAANLEAVWQQLLAQESHGAALHLDTAAEALRGMASELDILRTGDREVTMLSSEITDDSINAVYVTRERRPS